MDYLAWLLGNGWEKSKDQGPYSGSLYLAKGPLLLDVDIAEPIVFFNLYSSRFFTGWNKEPQVRFDLPIVTNLPHEDVEKQLKGLLEDGLYLCMLIRPHMVEYGITIYLGD